MRWEEIPIGVGDKLALYAREANTEAFLVGSVIQYSLDGALLLQLIGPDGTPDGFLAGSIREFYRIEMDSIYLRGLEAPPIQWTPRGGAGVGCAAGLCKADPKGGTALRPECAEIGLRNGAGPYREAGHGPNASSGRKPWADCDLPEAKHSLPFLRYGYGGGAAARISGGKLWNIMVCVKGKSSSAT